MAGINWVVPLNRKYDISLSISWWNLLNRLEVRKSFYFNREAFSMNDEIVFSYILSFFLYQIRIHNI